MRSTAIYDGLCNLCVNLVQALEKLDRGQRFRYLPMQDLEAIARFAVSPGQCELGLILIDPGPPERRFQGRAAAEEMASRLPGGEALVAAYRTVPGLTDLTDRCYVQVRDHRYDWFGRRRSVYRSAYGP